MQNRTTRNIFAAILTIAPCLVQAQGPQFLNNGFEAATCAAINTSDQNFNSCMPNVTAFAQGSNSGQLDIMTTGSGYGSSDPTGGNYFIGMATSERIAIALSSPLVPGTVYSINYLRRFTNVGYVAPAYNRLIFSVSTSVSNGTDVFSETTDAPLSPNFETQSFSFTAPLAATYLVVRTTDPTNTTAWAHLDFPTQSLLPVHFLRFDANARAGKIDLNWEAYELNTGRYIIEESRDGKTFSPAAELLAKGSGPYSTQQYAASFYREPGDWIFRIRAVDLDGTTSYSNARKVTVIGAGSIALSANPVRDVLKVTGLENGTMLHLYNSTGQMIRSAQANGSSCTMAMGSVSTGIYQLRVSKDGAALGVFRIVKE